MTKEQLLDTKLRGYTGRDLELISSYSDGNIDNIITRGPIKRFKIIIDLETQRKTLELYRDWVAQKISGKWVFAESSSKMSDGCWSYYIAVNELDIQTTSVGDEFIQTYNDILTRKPIQIKAIIYAPGNNITLRDTTG
ncbi:hypothetical protein A3F00_00880 [Candidatus Daviesbacteria bacterium RIFCSPHIGHO2_12_FULL_37_11]|uniref:Uncharacterized protein n=1 Tax=Candidatus Daviesbacteria bacterium RIFCSPHIGHO2_12_FULL_37_11 TaxID=1797777 RepID=A0A1F5K8K2_9BACT|nr:MAG: hypothetical protein A2111_00060 [Candidatus Daviesbacteria bacterium GWA1_38_6]OGE17417.1 MAG: hypothetical protein A2769_04580 [Candidatus Daviesbacteria bacterium RIFCSPHIGHO2_01_FULL_37_27]OGE37272.1 MAG: hypothetical protein A3F00_00880 [Candidatus Daviesbacteria bacterium RIFCSPHIGHO2_12_FULL_37_11]OGE46057.1 MAG: hypothetical protein A3B39_03560 [Candidatus Daviesbacteria bacterium RIFCSPLOWO2_01_FULL_37_10]